MASVIDTIKNKNRDDRNQIEEQTGGFGGGVAPAPASNRETEAAKQAADDTSARKAKDDAAAKKDVEDARKKWDEEHKKGKDSGDLLPWFK